MGKWTHQSYDDLLTAKLKSVVTHVLDHTRTENGGKPLGTFQAFAQQLDINDKHSRALIEMLVRSTVTPKRPSPTNPGSGSSSGVSRALEALRSATGPPARLPPTTSTTRHFSPAYPLRRHRLAESISPSTPAPEGYQSVWEILPGAHEETLPSPPPNAEDDDPRRPRLPSLRRSSSIHRARRTPPARSDEFAVFSALRRLRPDEEAEADTRERDVPSPSADVQAFFHLAPIRRASSAASDAARRGPVESDEEEAEGEGGDELYPFPPLSALARGAGLEGAGVGVGGAEDADGAWAFDVTETEGMPELVSADEGDGEEGAARERWLD